MVAIDLDDTLLNDHFKITEENITTIKKVLELGIVVCIISGRSYSSIKHYIKDLGIKHLCGSLNGAIVTNPQNGESVFSQTVNPSVTNMILKDTGLRHIHVNYYHDHKVICQEKNEIALNYMKMTNVEIEFVESLENYHKKALAGKLLLIDDRDRLDALKKKFNDAYREHVNITYSKPNFLEVYNKNASKGEAVRIIGQHYGLKPEEIIAIGDGENDIFMIEYAGLGVAMGNSSEEVKSKADFVTLSNNENGVAYVLEKFILNNSN